MYDASLHILKLASFKFGSWDPPHAPRIFGEKNCTVLHSDLLWLKPAKNKFSWSNFANFPSKFQQIPTISVSGHSMPLIFKICRTGISMMSQFHEFLADFCNLDQLCSVHAKVETAAWYTATDKCKIRHESHLCSLEAQSILTWSGPLGFKIRNEANPFLKQNWKYFSNSILLDIYST